MTPTGSPSQLCSVWGGVISPYRPYGYFADAAEHSRRGVRAQEMRGPKKSRADLVLRKFD